MQPQAHFAARLPRDGRVLDVGCGDFSRIRRYVANRRRDLRIVGIERFDGATIYGPLPARVDGPTYERLACDIESERFPFDDATFDGAYLSHVIEHLAHKPHALGEIARVLRPGGLLYVETPGPGSLLARRPPWIAPDFGGTIRYHDDPTHLGLPMAARDLDAELATAGLAVVRAGTFRELGLSGMPVYAAMAAVGAVPLVPKRVGSMLFGAGVRNLVGFGIYALAQKPAA